MEPRAASSATLDTTWPFLAPALLAADFGSKGLMMTSLHRRLGALSLAACLALSAQVAVGQTAPKTLAPGAAAPPAGAQGPVKIELQALQSPWQKVCGNDPANNKQICYTTRDFGQSSEQAPTMAVAIYQVTGEERRIARFLLPVALMLRPGFRLIIEKGEPIDGHFAICFPNGCFAEADLNGAAIAALKKATTINVIVRNQVNNEVTFVVPMKDFASAFDGPAVDPKVIQQQNEELQKQLEQKAIQQRQQLEKQQQSQATAPAATPPK
jgi:invasion protein IalB